jgi:hypothetical protein
MLEGKQSAAAVEPAFWHDDDGTLHDWYKVSIFFGRQFAGQFLFDPGAHPELGYNRGSVAYFCPDCGDVWARLVFTSQFPHVEPQPFNDPLRVGCLQHGDPWEIAGSLLSGRMLGILPYLPPDILQRELMIHCQAYERGEYV